MQHDDMGDGPNDGMVFDGDPGASSSPARVATPDGPSQDSMAVDDTHWILSSRGIRAPWDDRYCRFEHGDWQTFKTAGHTHHNRHMKREFVDACGGFVIHRWGPDGVRLPSYVRPDKSVCPSHGRKDPIQRGRKEFCGLCGKALTKYTQTGKTTTGRSGKLFDVHPRLAERLHRGGEPVYVCLEGCLKADAVAGTGRLAVSCHSVTCWDVADEDPKHWAIWLPLLQQAPVVYVVPDSDYLRRPEPPPPDDPEDLYINRMVRTHTNTAVGALQYRHQIPARYAVPPYLLHHDAAMLGVDTGRDARMKRGIDDHIAQGGNFRRWHQQRNPLGIHYYGGRSSDWSGLPKTRADADRRDVRFLTYLEKTRDRDDGTFTITHTAGDLGWPRLKVTRAWQSCVARGVLEGLPRPSARRRQGQQLARVPVRDSRRLAPLRPPK
jgi:hypothetical protein